MKRPSTPFATKKPRIDRRRYPRELLSRITEVLAPQTGIPKDPELEAWNAAAGHTYLAIRALRDTFPADQLKRSYYGQKGGLTNPFYSTKP